MRKFRLHFYSLAPNPRARAIPFSFVIECGDQRDAEVIAGRIKEPSWDFQHAEPVDGE